MEFVKKILKKKEYEVYLFVIIIRYIIIILIIFFRVFEFVLLFLFWFGALLIYYCISFLNSAEEGILFNFNIGLR